MPDEAKENNALNLGCRTKYKTNKTKKIGKFNDLFNTDWEVFVIKKDKITGEYVGKTACCALSPV